MRSALFTYRRRVTNPETKEVTYNDNYINPMNVISAFWETNESGNKVLNVFLSNLYKVVFDEKTGERLINHLEEFLRYTLFGAAPQTTAENTERVNPHPKRTVRRPIQVEEVEEETVATEAAWSQPTA